jgi:hypothetical protein
MRAADDYAVIRALLQELQRQRRGTERTVRDWKDAHPDPTDSPLVEEVKKIIVRARFVRE